MGAALLVFLALLATQRPDADSVSPVLLTAMVLCGCCEAVGALVSSVAVKKDWLPAVYSAGGGDEKLQSELADINSWSRRPEPNPRRPPSAPACRPVAFA